MSRFTYCTTHLLTGQLLSTVELSSFYWDESFNQPGSGLATARYDVPSTIPENFPDWSCALWVLEDGVPIWGGIVGKTQPRGNTRVVSIPVVGFFEYYRNRFLRSAAGMAYGNSINNLDIKWDNVDQFRIFLDCINHAHTFLDGDIGVGVEFAALSGVLRTAIWEKSTVKRLGVLLEEYMAATDGFSYRQVYHIANGLPAVRFKLEYPVRTSVVDTPLVFQPEYIGIETRSEQNSVDFGGASGDYASTTGTDFTGDIDIIVSYITTDWTPAAIETLDSEWGAPGNKRFRFQLLTTGHLRFEWTEDGTTVKQENSDYAVSFTSGAGIVRVTLDVDNGAGDYRIDFYESTDGIVWTPRNDPPPDPFEPTFSVLF